MQHMTSDRAPVLKKISYKWFLGLVMVTVLVFGWKYPSLGFIVPLAMGAGVLGSFFRGRWVCGNLCPRGSFLDTWFKLISANNALPDFFKTSGFRWVVLIALMGFMAFRLSQNPSDMAHWGLVFWQMCLITTIIALGLGLRYGNRSWCAFCPVGTMAGQIGAEKYPLQIHSSCSACRACESSCPMELEIVHHLRAGKVTHKDCLKCSECIDSCPRGNILSWPHSKAA